VAPQVTSDSGRPFIEFREGEAVITAVQGDPVGQRCGTRGERCVNRFLEFHVKVVLGPCPWYFA
jgi:hypothetical protein